MFARTPPPPNALKCTVMFLPSVFCPNCQSWHSCSLGLLSSESLWLARRAVKKYGERCEMTRFFSSITAEVLPLNQTCAICIAWLLLRSHILAVLSQEAVKTLLPSWLKRRALLCIPWSSLSHKSLNAARTYVTPACTQHWTCVHLLGFGDRLTVVLHLPASDLFQEDERQA